MLLVLLSPKPVVHGYWSSMHLILFMSWYNYFHAKIH